MLRRLLATVVPVCATAAAAAALGITPVWAAAIGAPLGGPAGSLGSAARPDPGGVTAPVTVRLLPSVQHSSTQQRDQAASRDHAPELGATGNAIDADPFGTCVSCTSAGAGSNSSSSDAQGLHLADESVSEGQSPENGYASGEIVSVPANPLLGLVIGRYDTANRSTRTASEAHSSATFVRLALGDGTPATISVLDARSDATHNAGGSHGRAASNGVVASVASGQLVIILLHSDADGDGPGHGHVYVADVNDNEIMSSKQFSGAPVVIPRVATIAILSVGPNGAVVGGVNDGKSQLVAGLVTSSVESPH
jgi:hypothetical protein